MSCKNRINGKKVFLLILIIVLILITLFAVYIKINHSKKEDKTSNNGKEMLDNQESEIVNQEDKASDQEDEDTIEQLKEEYKYTGESDLYQVETEVDGRKVLTIIPSIEYKVAFSGMITNTKPELDKINEVFDQYYPNSSGIWIVEKDRNSILEYLNNCEYLSAQYSIDEDGYLHILKEENLTKYDKIIKEVIEGDSQYLFSISSICYQIDRVTGEVIDNQYNLLEEYQTYEYFQNENSVLIFVTENLEDKLETEEIFISVIDLIDIIESNMV